MSKGNQRILFTNEKKRSGLRQVKTRPNFPTPKTPKSHLFLTLGKYKQERGSLSKWPWTLTQKAFIFFRTTLALMLELSLLPKQKKTRVPYLPTLRDSLSTTLFLLILSGFWAFSLTQASFIQPIATLRISHHSPSSFTLWFKTWLLPQPNLKFRTLFFITP